MRTFNAVLLDLATFEEVKKPTARDMWREAMLEILIGLNQSLNDSYVPTEIVASM